MYLYHYTDRDGYNAIVAAPTWLFIATQPPGDHAFGAYFTTYGPAKPLYKLGIPAEKRTYVFCFSDVDDLLPMRGGRGSYVVYCAGDYRVVPGRQVYHGPVEDYPQVMT